jgi:hypothetical protein
MAERELGLLEDAAKASGLADQQQPFMVAVDTASGKVTAAWKGTARRTGRGYENTQQYPVTAATLAAAKRHGEIIHKQRGRK